MHLFHSMRNFVPACLWTLVLGVTALSAPALEVILPPDQNYTRLHAAAEHGDLGQLREALKALPRSRRAAELNRLDREGYTPLTYAARGGALDLVKLLVEAGAAVDVADEQGGWTPLLQAADQRHADVVRYLLEHGANPNTVTRLGYTPLSVALAGSVFSYGPPGDRDATVKVLLEKRADPAPLLAAADGRADATADLRRQIDALQAERQRLTAVALKFQNEREQLERECRRLEAECQRLQEIIEKIRSATGNPGYHPAEQPR